MIYGYLAAFLVVAALLGGSYYKGHSAGADGVRTEWQTANVAALAKAEEDRSRQEQLSRQQAAQLESAQAKIRRLGRERIPAVEGHIQAAAIPAVCRLSDDLMRDWNRSSNIPGEDAASGKLPTPGGTASPADRPVDGGPSAKPSPSG